MDVTRALSYVNDRVRALSAYHLAPDDSPVKVNQNENPHDWPGAVKAEAARFCRERPWNRYPPFIPGQLRAACAEHAGVEPSGVIVGNGSNEMLLLSLLTLTRETTPVVSISPTFTVYRLLAEGLGRRFIEVALTPDLAFDVERIIDAVRTHRGALLILASPNNPTGSALAEAGIRRILSEHHGVLLLDQAYVEFGGYDAVPLLCEYANLIITRTFSKAFAAAGLRIGYCAGAPEMITEINKLKLPYNINFFTEYVARLLLAQAGHIGKRLDELVRRRDELHAFLREMPFVAVYPSNANFVLVRTRNARALFEWCRSAGVLVRDVSSYPMLDGCLRISVGSDREDRKTRAAVRSYFRKNLTG